MMPCSSRKPCWLMSRLVLHTRSHNCGYVLREQGTMTQCCAIALVADLLNRSNVTLQSPCDCQKKSKQSYVWDVLCSMYVELQLSGISSHNCMLISVTGKLVLCHLTTAPSLIRFRCYCLSRATALLCLQEVVALIAYEQPEHSPLSHLLHRQQRERVADVVNAAVLQASSAVVAAANGRSGGDGHLDSSTNRPLVSAG